MAYRLLQDNKKAEAKKIELVEELKAANEQIEFYKRKEQEEAERKTYIPEEYLRKVELLERENSLYKALERDAKEELRLFRIRAEKEKEILRQETQVACQEKLRISEQQASEEKEQLRFEIQALKEEIQALKQENAELKTSVQKPSWSSLKTSVQEHLS